MSIFAPSVGEKFYICGRFEEIRHYRCTGYMRIVKPGKDRNRFIHKFFVETRGKRYYSNDYKWKWCSRRQAEFVCGAGIAGCRISLKKIHRNHEIVNWKPEHIKDAKDRSRRREGEYFQHGHTPTASDIANRSLWRSCLQFIFLWKKV